LPLYTWGNRAALKGKIIFCALWSCQGAFSLSTTPDRKAAITPMAAFFVPVSKEMIISLPRNPDLPRSKKDGLTSSEQEDVYRRLYPSMFKNDQSPSPAPAPTETTKRQAQLEYAHSWCEW
jgi:hypothetical protein